MTDSVPTDARFDLFICHVSKADGKLARNIKRGLEQLAAASKPPRHLRIFVDHDNVAAGSDLPSAIQVALAQSNQLLILVRPELDQRDWCKLEIAHWLTSRPNELPLLAHSGGGTLSYADGRLLFESSDQKLPEPLAEAYRTEPSWVDLRPAHVGDDWWIHMAKIASPLLSRAPQDLFHAHAAEIRRKLWRTRLLLVAVIVFASGAIGGLWHYIHAQSIELERLALLDLQSGVSLVARNNFTDGLPRIEAAAKRERQTRRAQIYANNVLRTQDRWQVTSVIRLPDAPIVAFRVGNTTERLLVTDARRHVFRSAREGAFEDLKSNIVDDSVSPDREHMLLETANDLSWCSWSGPCVPVPVPEFKDAALADRHLLVVTPSDLVIFDLPGMARRECPLPAPYSAIDRAETIDGASFVVASGDKAWRLTGADCAIEEIEGGWAHVESVVGAPGRRVVVATDPGGLEEPYRVAVDTDCGLALSEENVGYRNAALHPDCTALAVTLDDTVMVVRHDPDGTAGSPTTMPAPFEGAAELQFVGDTLMLTSTDHVQFSRADFSGEKWPPIRSDVHIDSAWAIDDARVYVLTSDGDLRLWTRVSAPAAEETKALPDSFLDAESGMVGNRHRARTSGSREWLVDSENGAQKGPFVHETDEDVDRVCEATGFWLCPYPSAAVDAQGEHLLTAVGQEPARLWRVANGTYRTLAFGEGYIRSVHLSDSGDVALARVSSFYGSENEEIVILQGAERRNYPLRHGEWLADASPDVRFGLGIRKGQASWLSFGSTLERLNVEIPFSAQCGQILSADLFYLASVEDEVMLFDADSRLPLTPVLAAANPDGEICPTVKWEPSRVHDDGHAIGRIAVQASGDKTWRIFKFEQDVDAEN